VLNNILLVLLSGKLKIGFSSNAYTKKSLEYAIQSISDIGYEGIEIVLDIPHAFLPISEDSIKNIQSSLEKCKLKVTNLNANTVVGWYDTKTEVEKFEPSLSNTDEKLRRWRISYTKKAIDLASKLNAPSICTTSGVLNNLHKNTLKNLQSSLKELDNYAEEKNVKLAIEYEPGLLIGKADDVFPLTKEFSNVGLNFDVCHAAVLGEQISEVIEKFGKKIFHTHISDCKNREHYHLIPGEGTIDFDAMYSSLLKIGYNGFLTAELYTYSSEPEMAAKKALIRLKNLVN